MLTRKNPPQTTWQFYLNPSALQTLHHAKLPLPDPALLETVPSYLDVPIEISNFSSFCWIKECTVTPPLTTAETCASADTQILQSPLHSETAFQRPSPTLRRNKRATLPPEHHRYTYDTQPQICGIRQSSNK